MKYIVQYALPYEHRVRVGIEAESRDAAIAKAGEMYDRVKSGRTRQRSRGFTIEFGESGNAGIPLEFTVEAEVAGDWPEPDVSVKALRRRGRAFQAAHLLVEACRCGEARSGSIV